MCPLKRLYAAQPSAPCQPMSLRSSHQSAGRIDERRLRITAGHPKTPACAHVSAAESQTRAHQCCHVGRQRDQGWHSASYGPPTMLGALLSAHVLLQNEASRRPADDKLLAIGLGIGSLCKIQMDSALPALPLPSNLSWCLLRCRTKRTPRAGGDHVFDNCFEAEHHQVTSPDTHSSAPCAGILGWCASIPSTGLSGELLYSHDLYSPSKANNSR